MQGQEKDQLFDSLLEKYITQEISYKDKEILFSMVMESDDYRNLYEKANKLDTLLHVPALESNMKSSYDKLSKEIDTDCESRRFNFWPIAGKVAAAIVLVILSSIGSISIYKTTQSKQIQTALIETSTPLGGQTKIVLPDGSVAWLNSKSNLKYNATFGKDNRNLYLTGEAYFEVSKNKENPFSVKTDHMEVIATGTVFNVRSYADDANAEVQLIEGGVDILVSNQHLHLNPNEKATYNLLSEQVMIGPIEDTSSIDWIKGKIAFNNASVPEIIKNIERKFNVNIKIESEKLKHEYFKGSINWDMNLYEILNYIDVDKKYKVELNGENIIIKDKK